MIMPSADKHVHLRLGYSEYLLCSPQTVAIFTSKICTIMLPKSKTEPSTAVMIVVTDARTWEESLQDTQVLLTQQESDAMYKFIELTYKRLKEQRPGPQTIRPYTSPVHHQGVH